MVEISDIFGYLPLIPASLLIGYCTFMFFYESKREKKELERVKHCSRRLIERIDTMKPREILEYLTENELSAEDILKIF